MQNAVKVLIVEDEPHALMGLAELITGWGYSAETARDGVEGWEKAQAWNPAIVITDLKMPRLDGIGLLTKLAEEGSGLNANLAVVVLTALGSIQLAVEAMKLGAYDFLQKPVDATRLRTILANATRQRDTEIELEVARRRLRETGVLGALVGNSRSMREIFGLIEQIASSNVSVLITGESGTGKELVARTLHDLSPRKPRPFVAVNCAAIPDGLVETELFGYEEGAFTGARRQGSRGRLREAHGGILFLDEIGDMPLTLQARLLRVLQDRVVTPLGGGTAQQVDLRLICATHRDLRQMVQQGSFRADLYYRLCHYPLRLPPLCARGDVAIIAQRLLDAHGAATRGISLSAQLATAFRRYSWPGNLRELSNLLQTLLALVDDQTTLELHHLPVTLQEDMQEHARAKPEPESNGVAALLERFGGNASATARALGISRSTLYRKLKQMQK